MADLIKECNQDLEVEKLVNHGIKLTWKVHQFNKATIAGKLKAKTKLAVLLTIKMIRSKVLNIVILCQKVIFLNKTVKNLLTASKKWELI